jgi:hypothetical protein
MGDNREALPGTSSSRTRLPLYAGVKFHAPVGGPIGVTMSLAPHVGVTAMIALCAAGGVWAQDSTYRSVRAMSGQSVRLSVHFTLKKDCSAQPPPDIRVVTPPANGTLSVRAGTARAPQAGQCRNIETEARVVFYQSNQGYTGPDQVVVELKKANGSTETQSVAITVEPAKRPDPQKPGATEL